MGIWWLMQAGSPTHFAGTYLVGAMRPSKLLDGLVCAPWQLQGDVAAPALVAHPAYISWPWVKKLPPLSNLRLLRAMR
jgi:hypothetical protein